MMDIVFRESSQEWPNISAIFSDERFIIRPDPMEFCVSFFFDFSPPNSNFHCGTKAMNIWVDYNWYPYEPPHDDFLAWFLSQRNHEQFGG